MKAGPQLYLRCEWCLNYFPYHGGKRKRFCSDAHKQAQWRSSGKIKATIKLEDGPVNPHATLTPLEPVTVQPDTHECVEGFIYGVFNNGICNQCGAKQFNSQENKDIKK